VKVVIEWERQKVEHLLNSVMNVLRMQTFAKNISYVTVTDKRDINTNTSYITPSC